MKLHIPIVFALLLACATFESNAQITELAKKLLPEWMTKDLANLIAPPTMPPEKRILFKLNGPGFFVRKVPTRGPIGRPSKVYIRYALPQQGHPYKMFRAPGNYIGHPYQFEKITTRPEFEYVFEKPSIPIATTTYHIPQPAPPPYYPPPQAPPQFESGPIHTIPAPNLSGLAPQGSSTHEQIFDNQPIYYPRIQQQSLPEAQAQTYQVTEEQTTNDLTIVDPVTGAQKLYAPDPDPSLPTKPLPIEVNPLSKPTLTGNRYQLPLDVIRYDLVENNDLAAKLQEHIKMQQGLFQENPTPYNPTFLVTQSNNLLEQYQNVHQVPIVQLFKPEPNPYGQEVQQHHFNVASPGQIHAAQLNEANQNSNSDLEHKYQGDQISNSPPSHSYYANAGNQKDSDLYAYQWQPHSIDKLSLGTENIKIYVPDNDNYAIQSRADEDESTNIYTNHKEQYTEITRTPPPVIGEDVRGGVDG